MWIDLFNNNTNIILIQESKFFTLIICIGLTINNYSANIKTQSIVILFNEEVKMKLLLKFSLKNPLLPMDYRKVLMSYIKSTL